MVIKVRKNINVSAVPVPICDPCWDGFCTDCEGGNCACQWTHHGPDWDEIRPLKDKPSSALNRTLATTARNGK